MEETIKRGLKTRLLARLPMYGAPPEGPDMRQPFPAHHTGKDPSGNAKPERWQFSSGGRDVCLEPPVKPLHMHGHDCIVPGRGVPSLKRGH